MPATQCPRCERVYHPPDSAIGKKIRCKYCGNIWRVEPESEPLDELEEVGEIDLSPRDADLLAAASGPAYEQPAYAAPAPARRARTTAYASPASRGSGFSMDWARHGLASYALAAVATALGAWIGWTLADGNMPANPGEKDAENRLAVVILFAGGFFSLAAVLFDWDWFFDSAKARKWVESVGRGGARIGYGIFALALCGFGVFVSTKIGDGQGGGTGSVASTNAAGGRSGPVLSSAAVDWQSTMEGRAAVMNELADVLQTVHDETSARQASARIHGLARRVKILNDKAQRLEQLPPPSHDELKWLQETYEPQVQSAVERFEQQTSRVQQIPVVERIVLEALQPMAQP